MVGTGTIFELNNPSQWTPCQSYTIIVYVTDLKNPNYYQKSSKGVYFDINKRTLNVLDCLFQESFKFHEFQNLMKLRTNNSWQEGGNIGIVCFGKWSAVILWVWICSNWAETCKHTCIVFTFRNILNCFPLNITELTFTHKGMKNTLRIPTNETSCG